MKMIPYLLPRPTAVIAAGLLLSGSAAAQSWLDQYDVPDAPSHIWTANPQEGLGPVENAYQHYRKHGAEVGAVNAVDYLQKARQFLLAPPEHAEQKTYPGVIKRYDDHSGLFGSMTDNGVPKTFMVPTDGYDYWLRQ
jgi:pyocin large subunit-like protein